MATQFCKTEHQVWGASRSVFPERMGMNTPISMENYFGASSEMKTHSKKRTSRTATASQKQAWYTFHLSHPIRDHIAQRCTVHHDLGAEHLFGLSLLDQSSYNAEVTFLSVSECQAYQSLGLKWQRVSRTSQPP